MPRFLLGINYLTVGSRGHIIETNKVSMGYPWVVGSIVPWRWHKPEKNPTGNFREGFVDAGVAFYYSFLVKLFEEGCSHCIQFV